MGHQKMTKNERNLMKNKNRCHYITSVLQSNKKNTIRNKYIRKCGYMYIKDSSNSSDKLSLYKKTSIKETIITFNNDDNIIDKVNIEINKLDKEGYSYQLNKALLLNIIEKMTLVNKKNINYENQIVNYEKQIDTLQETSESLTKEILNFKEEITKLSIKGENKEIKQDITSKKNKMNYLLLLKIKIIQLKYLN